jgi:hypothetical protein
MHCYIVFLSLVLLFASSYGLAYHI